MCFNVRKRRLTLLTGDYNARSASHETCQTVSHENVILPWGSPSATLFSLSFPQPHSSHISRYNMNRTNILQGSENVVVSGSTLNATTTINYNYSNRATSDAVIPLKPNSSTRFTGRTEVIAKLKDHFIGANNQPRTRKYFLLHGMGGIGKTQICLRFIEEMSD